MFFQDDEFFESEVALSLEAETSSISEVDGPVGVASFFFIEDAKEFICFSDEF